MSKNECLGTLSRTIYTNIAGTCILASGDLAKVRYDEPQRLVGLTTA